MSPRTKTRAAVAILLYIATNAVLFSWGLIIALITSRAGAAIWIPVAVIASLVVAVPVAREIAPRLRTRSRAQLHYQPITLRTQVRRYTRR